jgi:hypothetical protein
VSLRSRLRHMIREAPSLESQAPPAETFLDDGRRLALVRGESVPWPSDRPLRPICKVYLFDPRAV